MGSAGLPMVPSSKVAYIQNPGVEWGFRWEGGVVAPWSMSPAKKDPRVQAGCKGLCNECYSCATLFSFVQVLPFFYSQSSLCPR